MKITIQKIAQMAGVSRGTVDKVIHNRPGVNPSVQDRVLEIIQTTGYEPLHTTIEQKDKVVAIVMPRLSNSYFAAYKRGLDLAIKNMERIQLEYYFCEASNITGMLAALDHFSKRPISAYIIRGVQSRRLRDRLNKLRKPIIFIDSDVPDVRAVCKVGEDCYKSGRMVASLLAKSVGYDGEVAVISGSPKITGHRQRMTGFSDAIREKYPSVRVVDHVYSQDQSVVAYQRACKMLDEFPRLKGVCNLAGYTGEIGQAILERRRAVKVVCYDVNQDVATLIHKGVIEFSIGLDPYRQAQILLDVLHAYLILGKPPESEFVETPISVAFDETIDALMRNIDG